MLKRKEYVYETNNYRIINPDKDLEKKIKEEIIKHQKESGEVDFDNDEFNFYLFKTLVDYINVDFDFNKYSLIEFNDILNDASQEIETIAFYIGCLVSDIIINDLRQKQLEIKMANIELLKNTTLDSLTSFKSDLRHLEQNKKRIEDEKRINEIRRQRGLDANIEVKRLNLIQKFLYKHNLIK